MKKDFKSILLSIKQIYNRYLYVVAKPVIILLFLILILEVLGFIIGKSAHMLGYVFEIALPFLLGIILSLFLEPVNKFFQRRFKFKRILAVITSLTLTLVFVIGFIGSIVYFSATQMVDITHKASDFLQTYDYKESLVDIEGKISDSFITKYVSEEQLHTFIEEGKEKTSSTLSDMGETMGTYLKKALAFTSGIFTNFVPTLFLVSFISLFTSFFISKDKDKIVQMIQRSTPTKFYQNLMKIKGEAMNSVWSYLKGHVILLILQTVILLVGFLVIQSPNVLTFTLICFILGNIPVVGHYIFIAPFAIYSLIIGDMFSFYTILGFAIGASIIRNALEPKVFGDSLGVHPLLLLISIYVGSKILGGMGVIVGPFVLVFIKILFDTGIVKLKDYSQLNENTEENDTSTDRDLTE